MRKGESLNSSLRCVYFGLSSHQSQARFELENKELIGRSFDVFLRKRGMAHHTVILGQIFSSWSYSCLTRVSSIITWLLGTSPRVTEDTSFILSLFLKNSVLNVDFIR